MYSAIELEERLTLTSYLLRLIDSSLVLARYAPR